MIKGMWRKIINAISGLVEIRLNKFKQFIRSFYKGQHQLTSTTAEHRYPELFRYAAEALKALNGDSVSVLSYGCSTGEECFTLRKHFPTATIIGVDINKNNLKEAREKNSDSKIKFLLSTDENIMREGKYTAIFCLSVLCRWENTKDKEDCSQIYPFVKYQEAVLKLVDQLENGGLLIIYNSNFRFEDTRAFSRFEIVPTPDVAESGFVHKFDSNNKRILAPHIHCIYRKKNGGTE